MRHHGKLTAVLLSSMLLARSATADSPRAEARARFDEGVAAYDAHDYETARAKFLQAYAVGKHPDVLLNVAWSSQKAGRREEAATYFRRYLADAKDAPPARRAEAQRGLDEASVSTTTTTAAVSAPEVSSAADRVDDAAPARAPHGDIAASAMLGMSSLNLNLGVGARAGVTMASRVYVGGAFVYNVGQSTSASAAGYRSEASTSAWYVGPEAGYDVALGSFVVRPYAGLGVAVLSVSASGPAGGASASDSEVVLWPGATASYAVLGTSFTLGADLHLVTIPGGPAMCMFATAGMYL
jgi:tetratricopeptide (TPR) repeat protein